MAIEIRGVGYYNLVCKASLVYRVSSRIARVAQRNPEEKYLLLHWTGLSSP